MIKNPSDYDDRRQVGHRELAAAHPHPHEPRWKHMLQKPADELHSIDGHPPIPCAVRFSVAKGHLIPDNIDDPVIGAGCLKHIPGQIPNGSFRISDSLNIDIPLPVPEIGRYLIVHPLFDHLIPEFGFVDFRHRMNRQIEINTGRMLQPVFGKDIPEDEGRMSRWW